MNIKGNAEQNFYSWVGVMFALVAAAGVVTEITGAVVGSMDENPKPSIDYLVYGGAAAGLVGLLVSGLAQSKLDRLQGR